LGSLGVASHLDGCAGLEGEWVWLSRR